MRWVSAILLFMLLTLGAAAHAAFNNSAGIGFQPNAMGTSFSGGGSGGSAFTCNPTFAFADGTANDGSAAAPAGTAQQPTILNSYGTTSRAQWCVAGVDYHVGFTSGTSFSDPSTSPPAACSFNGPGSFLDCRGTNNQTIQNFDFQHAAVGIALLIDGSG